MAIVVACGAAVAFFSILTFYKGGVCWGPRYLTPLFALLWLFAPDGVAVLGRPIARLLLAAGVGVQLLGLAVVPERLYLNGNCRACFTPSIHGSISTRPCLTC